MSRQDGGGGLVVTISRRTADHNSKMSRDECYVEDGTKFVGA